MYSCRVFDKWVKDIFTPLPWRNPCKLLIINFSIFNFDKLKWNLDGESLQSCVQFSIECPILNICCFRNWNDILLGLGWETHLCIFNQVVDAWNNLAGVFFEIGDYLSELVTVQSRFCHRDPILIVQIRNKESNLPFLCRGQHYRTAQHTSSGLSSWTVHNCQANYY